MGQSIFRRLIILAVVFLCFTSAALAAEQQITINKATNQLAYYEGGKLVKVFPVGTGKTQGLTPEGNFKIVSKLKNPYYRAKNIPGGDPGNPLGVRWLGLDARGTVGDTYGIHGNSNPDSIGKYVSAGCIRMYNEDVIWLYDKVSIGTPVSIVNSSERQIASEGENTAEAIKIEVNGKKLLKKTYLKDGISFASLRELSELLECRVVWDSNQRAAYIYGRSKEFKVNLMGEIIIDGKGTESSPVELINNQMYIPVRTIAENLGAKVIWRQETSSVIVAY